MTTRVARIARLSTGLCKLHHKNAVATAEVNRLSRFALSLIDAFGAEARWPEHMRLSNISSPLLSAMACLHWIYSHPSDGLPPTYRNSFSTPPEALRFLTVADGHELLRHVAFLTRADQGPVHS